MAELVAELEGLLGSRREARLIVDELDELEVRHDPGATRRDAALALARRRSGGEPLQYVLGHWAFRALDLVVDDRALIPRPETEELVDVALELAASAPTRLAADLGCGCGAIALSLATETAMEVHGTDVSAACLELAADNARRVGATTVAWHLGSWYEALPASLRGRLGLVCANPPYVARAERGSLQRELDFEPALALYADDAADGTPGFAEVERVVGGAAAWLAPGGWLVVEHGADQGDAAVACARRAGLVDVTDRADLAGLPRVLVARSA